MQAETKKDQNKGKWELEILTLKDTVAALNEQLNREREAYL